MKVRWPGFVLVVIMVLGVLWLKNRAHQTVATARVGSAPSVILVADFREAEEEGDRCAEIIQAVREASRRGVGVSELAPDSNPELLRRYRLLTIPTVLVLDNNGREIARFEGEETTTVKAIKSRLAVLPGVGQ